MGRQEGDWVPADRFWLMHWGLLYASVCTSLSIEDATARLNAELPSGLATGWHASTDPTFADGSPNPQPCPSDPARRHVLFDV